MYKFVLVISVVLFTSCSGPKYTYYFGLSDTHQGDNFSSSKKVASTVLLTGNDPTTASSARVFYEAVSVAIDTGIVSVDSLPRKKPEAKPNPQSEKARKKQLYAEKKKAYLEAKKAYGDTKNRRLDGFAIAAPILFTIAFFCLPYPPVAFVFAILGLTAGVLGMKSRIWGLALASLIAASVILVFYIYMTLLLGGPPG